MVDALSNIDWMSRGNCVGSELDFIDNKSPSKIKTLKAVCNRNGGCPVRLECFWFAVDTEASGVWGGVIKPERDLMKYWLPRKNHLGEITQSPLMNVLGSTSSSLRYSEPESLVAGVAESAGLQQQQQDHHVTNTRSPRLVLNSSRIGTLQNSLV